MILISLSWKECITKRVQRSLWFLFLPQHDVSKVNDQTFEKPVKKPNYVTSHEFFKNFPIH